MKYSKYLIGAALTAILATASCTDDFEAVNTNPNKVYDVELGDVFPGTVYRTMNLLAELNYNEYLNFSRYAVIGFIGQPHQTTDDRLMRSWYVNILNDLVKLERTYSKEPEVYANRLAIVKTWKSYCFYVMASSYGPVPMSDAFSDGSDNKRYYKYDSEAEIYATILNDLDEAVNLFNPSTSLESDKLEMDPVFGTTGVSDLGKWQKFANTLRLNVALHIQNLDFEMAREHALDALTKPLLSSNNDNVVLQWGMKLENSNSYYYDRFIYQQTTMSSSLYPCLGEYFYIYLKSLDDPRLSKYVHKSNELSRNPASEKAYLYQDTITRPHQCFNKDNTAQGYRRCEDYAEHQADGLNAYRRDSIAVEYMVEYVPGTEPNSLATGWRWATVPGQTYTYTDPLNKKKSEYNPSFVQDNFVGENAAMTLLTYADACFMRAEAEVVFNGNVGGAKEAYEEGIKASMTQYGVSNYNAYLNMPGVKWGTDLTDGYRDRRLLYRATINGSNGTEGALEQIYKQRYFAGFFNGLEAWNLERRTRVMNFPPFFANNPSSQVEGTNPVYNYGYERFIYPDAEISKNGTAVSEAVALLQATSPYFRGDHSGNNVFTTLAFAKKVPDIEIADQKWVGLEIAPFAEYYKHTWGATYEELVENALKYTGEKINSVALGKISYTWSATIGTYDTEDMPEHEEK